MKTVVNPLLIELFAMSIKQFYPETMLTNVIVTMLIEINNITKILYKYVKYR